ncbi:hypothetical protein AB0K60_29770 [Thermopolyspora sp. NPDC052614]|uniref:hypothetical protein n=1 Tax=Thermopolyspora sp. NPDC052614 TaxID=3155682 RepID=UPI003446F03D
MRKVLAVAAVAGIMAVGFAASPAQASTTSQNGRSSNSACAALPIVAGNFKIVEVAGEGSVRDGLLNRNDLRAVMDDPAAWSRLRQAAAHLHGPLFDKVDAAAPGSRVDGLIRPADLKAFFNDVCV